MVRGHLDSTNQLLFNEIMGESDTSVFDFSDDLEFPRPVDWSSGHSASSEKKSKRAKKTNEQVLAEIMEETLLVLEEQTEEYQAKLFSQSQAESQDHLYYKGAPFHSTFFFFFLINLSRSNQFRLLADLLNKVLTSFEDIVRQANVTYKRFQALQQKVGISGLGLIFLPSSSFKNFFFFLSFFRSHR